MMRATTMYNRIILVASLCAALLCLDTATSMADDAAKDPCPILLRDVTSQTGIAFRHTDGSSGRRFIMETVTAGLATFDYNGDGLIDIYFLNGAPLRGSADGIYHTCIWPCRDLGPNFDELVSSCLDHLAVRRRSSKCCPDV